MSDQPTADAGPERMLAQLAPAIEVLSDVNRAFMNDLDEREPVIFADSVGIVARSALHEAQERLEAALALHDAHLGHQAVLLIRPGLDQALWLRYLASMEFDVERVELSDLLGQIESGQLLHAQNEWGGKRSMKALGFATAFINGIAEETRLAKARVRELGLVLGWPELSPTGLPVPSSAWIAEHVGRPRTYNLMFSAMSKPLHFSVGELRRRGWGYPGGPVDFQTAVYSAQRTCLALVDVHQLFSEVLGAVMELRPEWFSNGEQHVETGHSDEEIEAAGQTLTQAGKVPLIFPTAFNLHKLPDLSPGQRKKILELQIARARAVGRTLRAPRKEPSP